MQTRPVKPFSIVDVTAANLSAHPQVVCFINPKHEHYGLKIGWLKKRLWRASRSSSSMSRDGRLLADHYISMRRFGNILKKENPARGKTAGRRPT